MKIDILKSTNKSLKNPNYVLKVIRNELKYCEFEPYSLKKKFYYKGESVDRLRHGMGKVYYGNEKKFLRSF